MKRSVLFAALLLFALSASAEDRHQSYISYDDGGTLILQGEDGRELEARLNLPVYPGDEIVTNRRGRTEIRLADENVLALDRTTSVRFKSIDDSYEGDAGQTVVDLRYGKVMVYRRDTASEALRLDSASASYVASAESIFSIEADDRGRDRVLVFDGQVEVRTPTRKTRLRAGESANVDERGPYGLASTPRSSGDAFERWFMARVDRYDSSRSRYLDSRFSQYDEELSGYGSWIYVSNYGWAWRPVVSAGWRPYYNGSWYRSRWGALTWVSYEPWGWLPYHYGRWSYESSFGWVWVPGTGYAPAWVYWMYGPSYVGWAPAGWYDCYRPYYGWAGRPYTNVTATYGFGFNGRIRVSEIDLRPWTFVDGNGLFSNRVDRAAITTDAIRSRLGRDSNGGFATVSNTPARFTREQFRNPADAINRISRSGLLGTGSGPGTAPGVVDVTPYFRRDDNVPANVRERIVRGRPEGGGTTVSTPTTVWSGSSGGGGGVAPIGRGDVAPIGPSNGGGAIVRGGGDTPSGSSTQDGRIRRGDWRDGGGTARGVDRPDTSTINRGGNDRNSGSGAGRTRGVDREPVRRDTTPSTGATPSTEPSGGRIGRIPVGSGDGSADTPAATQPSGDESWRGRAAGRSRDRSSSEGTSRSEGSGDVPRRVIDRIGGARVTSGDGDSARSRPVSPRGDSGSSGRSSGGSVDRSGGSSSSPSPRSSESSGSSSSSPGKSGDGGGGRSEGGRIHRSN